MTITTGNARGFPPPFIIAIDGPAASGKGTLARELAQHLGYAFLDTGAVYRLVALETITNSTPPEIAAEKVQQNFDVEQLKNPALRSETVSQETSRISAIPEVRAILKDLQYNFAHNPAFTGTVLDGRDIGTIICPDAHLKLYITASVETRALRRFKEQQSRGNDANYDSILQEMKIRDERDSTRAIAPLKPAPDAVIIDTSSLDTKAVLDKALTLIQAAQPHIAL